MRAIIAGSRDIDRKWMCEILDTSHKWLPNDIGIEVVLSGVARGADAYGMLWADSYGIPVESFPADWEKYGKGAGYKRNELMAQNADTLIAFWDGKSKGTKHMIDIAIRRGLWVKVFIQKEK